MKNVLLEKESPAEEIDRLEIHVQKCLGNRVRHLHIRQQEAGLVLQGHAPSYYVKLLAQDALLKATDLPLAANDIEVK